MSTIDTFGSVGCGVAAIAVAYVVRRRIQFRRVPCSALRQDRGSAARVAKTTGEWGLPRCSPVLKGVWSASWPLEQFQAGQA